MTVAISDGVCWTWISSVQVRISGGRAAYQQCRVVRLTVGTAGVAQFETCMCILHMHLL